MKKNNSLSLKPTYWASISGGKDSYFMLKLILQHPELYPLNGVVYFELEIDYPFIKSIIDLIKKECVRLNIPMFCIKPENSWLELYDKYLFPTRVARWCNSHYKLSCPHQFEKMQEQYGNSVNWYIGYCYDEKNRYEKRKKANEIYPLVDFQIEETFILQWARSQVVYNDYYIYNDRCGCMWCPMASYINYAYLYKYYPDSFNKMISLMRNTELIREKELGRPFSCISSNPKYNSFYLENIIKTKWLKILEEKENNFKYPQLSFFDVEVF